jgi:hypothetical protein
MISYLNQSIVPILKTGASVEVDNTACLSMKNPDLVLQYIKSLELPKNQTLKVTGNQATSIGKWDVVLGRSHNVPAVAASLSTEVTYPSCKRNQGMNCIQQHQLDEEIKCKNDKNELVTLTCCQFLKKDYFGYPVRRGDGLDRRWGWFKADQCDPQSSNRSQILY